MTLVLEPVEVREHQTHDGGDGSQRDERSLAGTLDGLCWIAAESAVVVNRTACQNGRLWKFIDLVVEPLRRLAVRVITVGIGIGQKFTNGPNVVVGSGMNNRSRLV